MSSRTPGFRISYVICSGQENTGSSGHARSPSNPQQVSLSLRKVCSHWSSCQRRRKTKLPRKVLSPGGSLILYGKKSRPPAGREAFLLDFNLRKEETLYLSAEDGTILEEILIPDMGREDTDYVRDPFSGNFYEMIAN